jgi:serine/threonine protein kinase/tetratricopeptide (TPR) repeat protein
MQENENTRSYAPLLKGTPVNQYRIVSRIGSGGMGEVYLAEDTMLDRRVALKFIPSHLTSDEQVKSRFVREAKAAAKLHHPHIVTIFEVGSYEGRPFIAMEYVEGQQLNDLVSKKSLDIDTIIEYAIQLCQGLGEAHRAGIIHRDIKAANIAVDKNGRTRILDFGLAAVQGSDRITKTGSTLGTVSYMSPEQVSGREVDHRSDLFSLGIVLYEMIAGRTPFKRDSEGASLKAIMEDIPEPLARYRAGVPEALQNIVSKLLEKDRDVRYQSAEGVLADLKKILYDSQQSPTKTKKAWSKRAALITVSIAAVIVLALIGWKVFSRGGETAAPPKAPVLAVLPFKNLGSSEDDYFSEGITEEICSRLVRVKGLHVISSSSAGQYRGADKSADEIGRELGADYILEGTIRWDKSGDVDRIRILPRLTKVSDDYLMWADSYEQLLVRIFDVQSKIANQIVTALGLTLLEPGEVAPDYAPTTNMDAYNYYLRGLDLMGKGVFLSNLRQAVEMFDSAAILDPKFAMAWAKKSMALTEYEFGYIIGDNIQHAIDARESAEKAVELDPSLPDAHIALGWYYNFIERDYERSLSEFSLARSEVSSSADLFEGIGVVKMRQGRWQEALENFQKAARLDPLTVRRHYWIAECYSMVRDYDRAGQYIDRGLTLSPDDCDVVSFRIMINLLKYGSVDSPDRSFENIAGKLPIATISSNEFAPSFTLGLWRYIIDRVDPDSMIADLRKLRKERSPFLVDLQVAQLFDFSGRKDSARVYYDSAKILLTDYVKKGTKDFHVWAPLGLTYAYLGMADSAIWAGKTAKELMSVDDCHW